VGSKNLSDLFRQQAQTSADESLVLSSENKKRTDQIALLQKLRLDVAKTYHFVEPQLPPEAADRRFEDEASLLQRGLENRGDLKAAGMAASAARWDIRKAKGTYWPQLDLIGSATSGGRYLYSQAVNGQNVVPASQSSLADQLPNQVEYAIGIYLTWNLFDRFLNRQSVAIARASAENAEIDATDAGNRVKAEIRRAYGNYKTALQQLSASKKGEMAAQKAYDVIEGRYEVGSANFIDLITVQATLLQAQVARAQAVIDFMLQGKGLEFAIGETDAE
jgi:outer membrane protein